MKTKPVLVAAIFLFCMLAGNVAQAQSTSRFEASRHLKGFDEASFSEYGYLYDLKRFESRDGTVLSADQLKEIRAEWSREKTRVAADIERIAGSPFNYSLHLLDRQLPRHSFFSRVTFSKELSKQPVALYIQDLQKPVPKFRERVVECYGPAMQELVRVFDKEYATPLGLRPRKGHRACVLFVLASWGDFTNYMDSASRRGFYTNGAYYDHDLRAAVTYSDVFAISKSPENIKKRSALFAAALSLLHAHRSFSELLSANAWLYDGIAETLSRRAGDGLEIDPSQLSAKALRDLAAMLNEPAQRAIYFLPAHELFACRTQTEMYRLIKPRADAQNIPETKWWPRALAFYQKQAGVLVHFLRESSKGRFRGRFHDYVAHALAKNAAVEKVSETLSAMKAKALHAEHVKFLMAELNRRCPDLPLRPSDRKALLSRTPASGTAGKKAGDRSAQPVSSYVDPAFDPGLLDFGRFPPEITLGVALHEARAGRIESGLERIENLLVSRLKDNREFRDFATRETARLKTLLEFRGSFIKTVAASGKKLRVKHGGRTLSGTVEIVDGGSIRIRKNAGEATTIPIDALDPEQLLKATRSKKVMPVADWILGYTAFVAGNKIWRKYSKGESPEAAELRKDVPAIEAALGKAEAYAAILALSRTSLPADTTDALILLEKINAIFADHGGSAALEEQKKNVCQFAGHALAWIYDEKSLVERLEDFRGQVDDIGGGKIRITYEFNDPAELEDFESIDYLEELHEELPAIKTGKEESSFTTEKGSLVCKGILCLRLRVGFRAPLKLEYQLVWSSKGFEGVEILPHGWFVAGFCDDGYGSCIKCIENGNLDGYDKRANFRERDWNEWNYDGNTRYNLKLVHDGKKVDCFVDSKLENSIPCGPRREGNVFFWVHHDIFVKVKRLVVEGAPDEQSLHRLREEWILNRVAALDE